MTEEPKARLRALRVMLKVSITTGSEVSVAELDEAPAETDAVWTRQGVGT